MCGGVRRVQRLGCRRRGGGVLNADAVATADDGPAPCAAAGASGSAHGRPELARGARWWEAGPHISPPWPPRLRWWRRPPRGSQRARDFAGAWWKPRSRIHGTARHPERTACSGFNRPRGAAAGCRGGADRAPLVGGRPVQTRARRPLGLSGPDGRLRSQSAATARTRPER